MKKLILTLVCLGSLSGIFAQVEDVKDELAKTEVKADAEREDGWFRAGTFSFLLNQSAFSNWVAGGTNNVGGNVGLNYDFNYKKGDFTWDNRLVLAYGLNKLEGEDVKKTDDRIEFNSIVGKKANFGKYWSWSFFFNLRTQFTDGYNYDGALWEDFPTSGFFKPGYITTGPGLMYKKSENFKINLAPLTSKMTFLSNKVYTYDKEYANNGGYKSSEQFTTFGVLPGDNFLYQLGFYGSLYYKTDLMKNISMENIFNMYANYLEDFGNIDIDYTMNLVMQVNKYVSTNLTFQTIYDDDAYAGFQVREVFGAGLNYNF